MLDKGFLMNTFEEWRGSPAAREGQTCQACHMPERRHSWRGIHDPEMVRENLHLRVEGRRIALTNTAGHFTPTYSVPRIVVSAWLEESGREVPASRRSWTIQRQVVFMEQSRPQDVADTRLAPGEARFYEYDVPADPGAELVVSVDVEPDAAYRELYRSRLQRTDLTEEMRRLFQLALERPLASPFNAAVHRSPADRPDAPVDP
jgi:hypothetical protein